MCVSYIIEVTFGNRGCSKTGMDSICPRSTKNTESCHVYAEAAEADGIIRGHLRQGRYVPALVCKLMSIPIRRLSMKSAKSHFQNTSEERSEMPALSPAAFGPPSCDGSGCSTSRLGFFSKK